MQFRLTFGTEINHAESRGMLVPGTGDAMKCGALGEVGLFATKSDAFGLGI